MKLTESARGDPTKQIEGVGLSCEAAGNAITKLFVGLANEMRSSRG